MIEGEPSQDRNAAFDSIDRRGLLLHSQAFLEVTYVRQSQNVDWTRQIMYDFFTEGQEAAVSQGLEELGAIARDGEWWIVTDFGLQLRAQINEFYSQLKPIE